MSPQDFFTRVSLDKNIFFPVRLESRAKPKGVRMD